MKIFKSKDEIENKNELLYESESSLVNPLGLCHRP